MYSVQSTLGCGSLLNREDKIRQDIYSAKLYAYYLQNMLHVVNLKI